MEKGGRGLHVNEENGKEEKREKRHRQKREGDLRFGEVGGAKSGEAQGHGKACPGLRGA